MTLTLQARDQYDNALTTGGRIVTSPASGGSSTGQLSATSDNGDGTYSATFSAIVGRNRYDDRRNHRRRSRDLAAADRHGHGRYASPAHSGGGGRPTGERRLQGSVTPVVAVYDALGNPLPGIAVTFTVTAGGGSISGGTVQSTDGAGRASVTGWTLGTTAGENHLTVSGSSLSVTVIATGVPGPASFAMSLIVVSDDTVVAGVGREPHAPDPGPVRESAYQRWPNGRLLSGRWHVNRHDQPDDGRRRRPIRRHIFGSDRRESHDHPCHNQRGRGHELRICPYCGGGPSREPADPRRQ